MSATEADVAHVRRCFETFNERSEDLHGPALEPYFREFFADTVVIANRDSFPVEATYGGYEGYRQWWDDTYGPYRDIRYDVESIEPLGGHVLVVARIHGRPKDHPAMLEVRLALLYTLEDVRIARVEVFLDADRARAAVAA